MRCVLIFACAVLLIAFTLAEHSATKKDSTIGEHAHKTSKSLANGKKYEHQIEKGRKGKSQKVLHRVKDEEAGGRKHHSAAQDGHRKEEHSSGHGSHGAHHKHAEEHKKNTFEKGFREQYHKDEHKKSASWYSDKHKAGEWAKFGTGKTKHHGNSKTKQQLNNGKQQAKQLAKQQAAAAATAHKNKQRQQKSQRIQQQHSNQ